MLIKLDVYLSSSYISVVNQRKKKWKEEIKQTIKKRNLEKAIPVVWVERKTKATNQTFDSYNSWKNHFLSSLQSSPFFFLFFFFPYKLTVCFPMSQGRSHQLCTNLTGSLPLSSSNSTFCVFQNLSFVFDLVSPCLLFLPNPILFLTLQPNAALDFFWVNGIRVYMGQWNSEFYKLEFYVVFLILNFR